jgi:phage-related protein
VLGDVIPELERVKGGPGAQLAYLQDYAAKRGVPLGPEELSHFSQDPDLVKSLKAMHTWGITQDKDFQKALAVANVNKDSHLQGVRISADASKYASDSRAQLAKDRISADKSLSQDLSAAKNYQAQSVVYTNHAEKARLSGDDSEYLRLSELAKQATAQDLQAKAAAGDARAAQQLQLLQGLGVPLNNMPTTPATPPAAGGPRKPLSAY